MGQLERDAKRAGMELANDPTYGKVTGCIWGGAIVLGGIISGVGYLVHEARATPVRELVGIGCAVMFLVALIALVTWLGIRESRRTGP
jgi:hypothetical protein